MYGMNPANRHNELMMTLNYCIIFRSVDRSNLEEAHNIDKKKKPITIKAQKVIIISARV